MEVKHYKKYSETTLMNRIKVNNYLTVDKPFSFPCMSHCRPKLEVFHNEKLLGYIKEPNEFCCDPVFEIYNNSNQLIYKYYTDCCQNGFVFKCIRLGQCCEVSIDIFKGDKKDYSDNNIGNIRKVFGKCSECIANVCTYFIDFPLEATPEEKILLIMGIILMDYRYYGI